MSERVDTLPCPFCGSTGGIPGGLVPWVQCDECEAAGPSRDTEAEAIAAWNRRAIQALTPAPAGDWVMVPREPTMGMRGVMYRMPSGDDMTPEQAIQLWQAMLAATPQPAPSEPAPGEAWMAGLPPMPNPIGDVGGGGLDYTEEEMADYGRACIAYAQQHRAVPMAEDTGSYWCIYCNRGLPEAHGIVVHDDVPHPADATYDEQENPQ